jgi:hypothetical protein
MWPRLAVAIYVSVSFPLQAKMKVRSRAVSSVVRVPNDVASLYLLAWYNVGTLKVCVYCLPSVYVLNTDVNAVVAGTRVCLNPVYRTVRYGKYRRIIGRTQVNPVMSG